MATEQPSDYGRKSLNINYDRDAVLSTNQSTFGDCDGYFTRYDGQCHNSEDAVKLDHLVSIKEAWDSGLRGDDAWEDFDGNRSNLEVMTSSLNQSKGAADAAEWSPSNATCKFTETYVTVKDSYGLSVDQAEKQALLDLASGSGGNGNDGGNGNSGGQDVDCSDFETRAEPREHLTAGDSHRLDADGDGVPCESLPAGGGDDMVEAPEPNPVEGDLEVTG